MSIYQKQKDLLKMLQFKDIMHFAALILDIYRQDKHRQRPLHLVSETDSVFCQQVTHIIQISAMFRLFVFILSLNLEKNYYGIVGFQITLDFIGEAIGVVAGRVGGRAEILTGAVKFINSPIKPRHFLVASCIPSLPFKAFCMHSLVHAFILPSIINAHV